MNTKDLLYSAKILASLSPVANRQTHWLRLLDIVIARP